MFRAGGADRALGFVEGQTAFFKFYSAIVEQRAHLGLGIVNHCLVNHSVHRAGLGAIKVIHQPDIVTVIAAHIGQAIAERLPPREVLLEVGEATPQRMPPRINDLGLRQDQPDKHYVRPIVGQLVDEQRPVSLALDPGAFEVFLAQPAQISGGQFGQVDRVARVAPRQHWNIGQLAGPLDQAVAGEDLFDQSRTGARHPQHKDRIGGIAALPGPAG